MGGRHAGNSFLLHGTGPDGTFLDETRGIPYYVLMTPAIDCAGYAAPIDFFLNKLKQQPPDIGRRDERRDVFDELQPLFNVANTDIKILFPYNLTLYHWLTGEIQICKTNHHYNVEIFAHDPYGYGQMYKSAFDIVCIAIITRIKQIDEQATFRFHHQFSYFGTRQALQDCTSCGVIVVEDILKRIRGKSLNMSKPYPVGAAKVRREHLELIQPGANFPTTTFNSTRTKPMRKLKLDEMQKTKFCSLIIAIKRPELKDQIIGMMCKKNV